MGTYYIPRNVKGETRLLYIFSIKSLITTAIGAFVGLLFYLLFTIVGLDTVGLVILGGFALIGFVIGAVKIPIIAGKIKRKPAFFWLFEMFCNKFLNMFMVW